MDTHDNHNATPDKGVGSGGLFDGPAPDSK